MKKRVLALAMTAVMAGSLTICSGSSGVDTKTAPAETEVPASGSKSEVEKESKAGEGDVANTASSGGGSEDYRLVPATDLGTIDDKPFNQGAWEGLKKYTEENNTSYKYYQPQEGTTDPYLETVGLIIEGGVKLVVCSGLLFEEPICLAQSGYPDVHLVLLDGELHDANYNCRTNDNVMPILFQEDQIGLPVGHAIVGGGYARLGFMGGMAVPAVIRSGYGFIRDAKFAAGKDGIMGPEIMYNYTGTLSATPKTQPITVPWYQNGVEVVSGCGGAAGNSVAAAAQEKNAKVIGVDMDQSAESETVIASTMKLLSSPMYDGVKDFYNGSFPGGKISVFTVTSNGVGLPMGISKFEKFSQEQYDTACKKLADEEIELIQFSADDNDPTKDLIDLTNIKATFVEQGLTAMRAV